MPMEDGDTGFWNIKEIRKSFYQTTICFTIDGLFSDFHDECFLSEEILHPFDGFFSASWFDTDSYFHTYPFIRA